MATNNRDFRIKNGLVVEGSTATVNGNAIITSASSVNDLADVTVSSPTPGQVLKWNGTAWINDTDATGAGGSGNSFTTIDVPNGTDPAADSSTDTLTFADGANITITGDSATDTITVAVDPDIINVNSLTFDTTPTSPGTGAGTIFWDDGDGVPKVVLNANVTVGVNQELVLKVKNASGTTLTKGSVVYISGAQGQNPTVALADADAEGTSSKTFGFVAEQILDAAEGFVFTQGIIRGVNTEGFTEGGAIWLSTTAGQYTQTIPAEPAHAVFLGYAVKAHATAGEIIIKIQNGYELTELHGVLIDNGSVTDNEVLAYDTTSGLWINQTASEASLATSTHTHGNITNDGKVGSTSGLVLGTTTAGAVAAFTASAPSSPSTEFLRGDGTWVVPTDTNTTYAVSAETVAGGANLRLTGASPSSTDDVKIASGTNVTVTRTDADTITISSTDTDTVTRLQGTGGSLVSGDVTIQGSGATATSQSGNTITIATSTDNFLINGAFDVWQRGTSSTTNGVYLADRWLHSRAAGTHTVSRSTDVPDATLPYSLSFASTSGTNPVITQRIEAANAARLVGQTVTFSIWAKSTVGTGSLNWSTNFPTTTADTFSAVTTDQSGVFEATMTVGTWTRYSATFTVAAGAVRGYGVSIFRSVATTSTTTLYAGAQLELGSVLTAFRRNATSIQAELAACQRYYHRFGTYASGGYLPTAGQVFNTVLAGWFLPFPVRMRTSPVADFSAASTFTASTASGGSTAAGSTVSLSSATIDMGYVAVGWSAGQSLTAGHATILSMTSSGFLGFNSEL